MGVYRIDKLVCIMSELIPAERALILSLSTQENEQKPEFHQMRHQPPRFTVTASAPVAVETMMLIVFGLAFDGFSM